MKKLILFGAAATLFVSTAFKNVSPEFEGTIVYDIKFDEQGMPPEQMAMMAGSTSKLTIKGDKSRMDMDMGMMTQSVITDKRANISIILMDMSAIMGQKIMMRNSLDSLNKEAEKQPAPKINYLKDTKEIAGYKCKNAEVITTDEQGKEMKSIVWFTEDLPYEKDKGEIKGLKGFPLEYTMSRGGAKFTMTAKSITKEKIADSAFDIPGGYTEMSQEELKNMFGGRE